MRAFGPGWSSANRALTASRPDASANEIVKLLSLGSAAAPTTLPARIDATICEPRAPPRLRTIVLMPVATPVWSGGTASTMRLASAAKARPMPSPSSAAAR